ncbi:MAG: hypothetical protein DCO96_05045 [Fluviicola sp. XM-24bin1]|nr:MAG: hypothetical protein DCO96_05045 [Fluviicola sp. XM-24bin1]
MLVKLIHVLLVVMILNTASAQIEYDASIPVYRNGNALELAWAGGLNHVQISDFDFDFDGDLDLFIFDITANNIRVLVQEDDNGTPYYDLLYNAKSLFPTDVVYRGIMVDYDNDGRKDLWTYGLGGLKVYRNVGDQVNGLQWQLQEDLIFTLYATGANSPLLVSQSDMPAIVDVDFDGDIDILTFHTGGEVVEYHQNQSMELYGIPDSLVFEQKNECWGLFREASTNNTITLNDPWMPCVGGSIPNPLRYGDTTRTAQLVGKMHAGSSLLAIDLDNSGVLDLILGDAFHSGLVSLINGGTAPNTNSAMTSQDVTFPSYDIPLELDLFPVSFYVDVDFDGIKDLVVGSNVNNLAENESSIHLYKNMGSNALPSFSFQQENLFQGDMIEHGSGSIPVLFDENEDGLKDLLLGNFLRYKPYLENESTIAVYRNTGTATNPEFTFIDFDYLNLSQETFGLRLAPTFGDLDGDGDEDLLMGRTNGQLNYYENTSTGNGAVFGVAQQAFQDAQGNVIDVGEYSFPQLFDINKDSLIDLVIGNRTGEIYYYENVGSTAAPSFQIVDSTFGQVDVSGSEVTGYASPHFFRRNDTTFLLCGTYEGTLHYFDNIDDNLLNTDSFNLVTDFYGQIDVEGYSTVVVEDIDDNQQLNIFVGQGLGGLYHFNETSSNNIGLNELSSNVSIAIYPNPAKDEITVSAGGEIISSVNIMDVSEKHVLTMQVQSESITIPVSALTSGAYFVQVQLTNTTKVERFLKR